MFKTENRYVMFILCFRMRDVIHHTYYIQHGRFNYQGKYNYQRNSIQRLERVKVICGEHSVGSPTHHHTHFLCGCQGVVFQRQDE